MLPLNPAARLALGNGVRLFSFQERRQRDLHWRRTTRSLPLFLRLCLLPSSCLSPICCFLSFPCCSQRHPLRRRDVLLIDSRTFVTDLMADALGILTEQKSSNIKVMVIPFFFGWMHTNTRFSSPSLLRVLQCNCENGGSVSWSAPPIDAYTSLTPFSPFLARMRPSIVRLDRS